MQQRERVTIGEAGQISLPPAVLSTLELMPGDQIDLEIAAGTVTLRPVPRDVITRTYGLARDLWRSLGGSADFVRETEESWRS